MVINPDVVFCLFREAVGPFRKMSIIGEENFITSCAPYILWLKQVSGSHYTKNMKYKNNKEPVCAQFSILRTARDYKKRLFADRE